MLTGVPPAASIADLLESGGMLRLQPTAPAREKRRDQPQSLCGSTRITWDIPAPTLRPVMFQVRIHGRGGQGVVTAAELLSVAAFIDGRYAQAFPSFGSERTGAPVVAFCRVDDRPIRSREPIVEPDALIVQDSTLLHQVDLFSGI